MKNILNYDNYLLEMAKKGFMDVYTKRYKPEETGYGNADKWKHAFDERMDRETAKRILDDKDPYKILGVSHDADKYEIKSAYRKLAMEFHPDRNQDRDTTIIFQEIQAAYEMLRDN
jgi:DnaJ-class molecular chaperone